MLCDEHVTNISRLLFAWWINMTLVDCAHVTKIHLTL